MEHRIPISNWSLAWIENVYVKSKGISIKVPNDVTLGGYRTIKASVPGNFELDFMREGILDDVYFGQNPVKAQRLENLHLYYFTEFNYQSMQGHDAALVFGGIDTAA